MTQDIYASVRNLPTRTIDGGHVTPVGNFEERSLWYAWRASEKASAQQHVAQHLQSKKQEPTAAEKTLQWVREGRDKLLIEKMSPREAFYLLKEREATAKLADATAKQAALKSPEVLKALTTLTTLADSMGDSEHKLKTLAIIDAIKESPTDVKVLKTLAVNTVNEYQTSFTASTTEQLNTLTVERDQVRHKIATLEVDKARADQAAFVAVANLQGAYTSEAS